MNFQFYTLNKRVKKVKKRGIYISYSPIRDICANIQKQKIIKKNITGTSIKLPYNI